MRLIHAVRELNARARHRAPRSSPCTPRASAGRCSSARPTSRSTSGPASARPYLDHAVLERALRESRRRRRLGRLGLRRRGPGLRRAVRPDRRDLHRPEPRGDAPARRQDRLQAHRRGGRRPRRAVEPRRRGHPGGRPRARRTRSATRSCSRRPPAAVGAASASSPPTTTCARPTTRTRDEAQRAFGSGVVFLEKLVTGARHVEVQVIADGQGTAWALGVRDCSVQRRNQKVIEESASPLLAPDQVAELKASAERLAVAVGYAGAGTVEFLYHPTDRFFAFLEVNTRLQVEHPITEVTTDTDLVKLQIHVAGGGRLEGRPPVEQGHAIEARLNAEDPDRDFAPVPRPDHPAHPARRPRHPGRHRRRRGRQHPRRLRLDDRQDHRLRPRPRRGPRPAAPGHARHDRRHRGRLDEQELRPRPARPARGRPRRAAVVRHRLDRPGPRRRAGSTTPRTPASPSSPPPSRPTTSRSRPRSPACSRPPAAAARRCSTRGPARSSSSCAGRRTPSGSAASARSASGSPSTTDRRSTPTSTASTRTAAG